MTLAYNVPYALLATVGLIIFVLSTDFSFCLSPLMLSPHLTVCGLSVAISIRVAKFSKFSLLHLQS